MIKFYLGESAKRCMWLGLVWKFHFAFQIIGAALGSAEGWRRKKGRRVGGPDKSLNSSVDCGLVWQLLGQCLVLRAPLLPPLTRLPINGELARDDQKSLSNLISRLHLVNGTFNSHRRDATGQDMSMDIRKSPSRKRLKDVFSHHLAIICLVVFFHLSLPWTFDAIRLISAKCAHAESGFDPDVDVQS
jgi:hypothetical protein